MRPEANNKDMVERPMATGRICTVCTAEVAAFKDTMVCHCRELPWAIDPDTRTGVERLTGEVGWQPIETAPKDGSTVLLAERTWGGDVVVTPGRYFEDERGWWEHGSHPTDYADQPIDNPTHWMPLPEPPALQEGDKK